MNNFISIKIYISLFSTGLIGGYIIGKIYIFLILILKLKPIYNYSTFQKKKKKKKKKCKFN